MDPHSLHRAARELSGELDAEWTFPLWAQRVMALDQLGVDMRRGLDNYYEPLSSWDDVVAVLNMIQHLSDRGLPAVIRPQIALGFCVFDSMFRAPGGRLTMPGPTERFRGRHSVALVGLSGKGELMFANSWGEWGDGGFGYLSREYFEAHVDDVMLQRPTWTGPTPHMDQAMKARAWREGRPGQPSLPDFVTCWTTPAGTERSTIEHSGNVLDVERRRVFSLRDDAPPCDVLQLSGDGVVYGRAHVLHPRGTTYSDVEEVVVAPHFRRSGIGRCLVGLAEASAKRAGRVTTRLLMAEADAGPGRAAAFAWGDSCGYAWTDVSMRRPNLVAVAEKLLREPE